MGKATEEREGNSKGKGIVKQIPGGDNISHAIAFQMWKDMYKADSHT